MKRFVAIVFALLQLAWPVVGLAQTSDFASIGQKITSFDSNITIDRDNIAEVHETIVYSFDDGSHHGIFRVIPTAFLTPHGTKYTPITKYWVTDGSGNSLQIKVSKFDHDLEIRIGNPDALLPAGQYTYKINYSIGPVVTKESGYDLLFWNITGNGWLVPIDQVTARVTTPVAMAQTVCFTGITGSQAHDCKIDQSGSTVSISAASLTASAGLTLRGQLPPGSFSQYPSSQPAALLIRYGLFGFSCILILLALTVWAARLTLNARRKHDQTIMPEYEPPDGLTPGEMGVLDDRRSNQVEISATIIDLAVRKYIKIEQVSPPKWPAKGKYKLIRLAENAPLRDYERNLLDAFFLGGDTLDLSRLRYNQTLASAIGLVVRAVKHQLKRDVEKKGYYSKSFGSYFHLTLTIIGIAVWLVGLVVVFNPTATIGQKELLTVLMLLGSVLVLRTAWQRANLTKEGLAVWGHVEGFKWFLSMTEKDRLKFTDAPECTPALFSKMLPHAIALRVEKQWAKQFAGIDVSQGTYWYGGGVYNFSAPSDFASDLSSGLISSMNSSFSSSGSSGGGGAGGGGGGGGGGGW